MENINFKEASPFHFWENFGTLAKERIEAAVALTKTLGIYKSRQGFQKSHPQRNRSHGDGSQYSGCYNKHKGWQVNTGKANNMKQQSSKKWQLTKDHVNDSTFSVYHSLNPYSVTGFTSTSHSYRVP